MKKDYQKRILVFLFMIMQFCFLTAQNISTNTSFDESIDIPDEQLDALDEIEKTTISDFIPSPQLAMATEGYMVSAGDIYELAYAAGNQAVIYELAVDTTYKIRVSNLGVLNVRGFTFNQLKEQVERIVTKNYPLSGVQFVLKVPSQFKVVFKGEVVQTTEIQVWALTRLSDVLDSVLTDYSSQRNILITGSDGKKKYCDLYVAQRDGDLSNNPYLHPGDVITVNRFDRKVVLRGAVEREGVYELSDGENLQTLISKYGNGLAPSADLSRIEIYRVNNTKNSGTRKYIKNYTLDQDEQLENYDEITIPFYKEVSPAVFITGAINSSALEAGTISTGIVGTESGKTEKVIINFSEGETYTTLIRKNKQIFSSLADTKNAYIVRGYERISINLDEILYNVKFYSDMVVQANDTLFIPFKQFYVVVSGAVEKPGQFAYIPNRDYNYYISLAGGVIKKQNAFKKVVITDIDGNKLSKSDKIEPETTIEVSSNSFWYKLTSISSGFYTILIAVYYLVTVLNIFDVI